MAHVSISFRKDWSRAWDNWTILELWEIEDPYSRRLCEAVGCFRLTGHPEPQVSSTLHCSYDPTQRQPETFSQWPIKVRIEGVTPTFSPGRNFRSW